jgi:hypothetical protein
MKSKVLMVLAGAALSSVAVAATPDMDKAYAAELSADASARNSQLAAGMDHFKLTAGDSTLYIGGYEQFRWNSDFRSQSQTSPNENYTHGFNIVNTRVQFWGNTWTKELTYKFDLQLGGGGGAGADGTALKDAEFRYTWDNGFYVRGGQFKLPGLREELVGDQYQLLVNRGLVNAFFSLFRSQGVEIGYTAEQWRFMADFSDGANARNTDYNSANESDFAITARAEFQAMGTDWSRWNDFTSWRESDSNGLLIGLAGHYQSNGRTGPGLEASSDNSNNWFYTADVSYEAAGWNLFGAIVGNHFDPNSGSNIDNWGWIAQGGVFVTDQVELFGRYEGIRVDKDLGLANRTFHFIAFGGNYYVSPRSHTFKISADVVWSLSKAGQIFSGNTAEGVLGQPGKKGEVAVEVQAQVCW